MNEEQTEDQPEQQLEQQKPEGARKRSIILICLTSMLAGALLGAGWLFISGGDGGGSDEPELGYFDGSITEATPKSITLKDEQGKTHRMELAPEAVIDIANLQSHAAIGLKTRVYWTERDGEPVAVRAEDAPLE